jgi:hypothetical protein
MLLRQNLYLSNEFFTSMLCILSIIPCKIKLYSLMTGSVPVNILKIMLKPTELGPVCKATLHLLSQMLRNQWSVPSKTIVYSIQHRTQYPHQNQCSKNRPISKCIHPKNIITLPTLATDISKQITNHTAGMYQIHVNVCCLQI